MTEVLTECPIGARLIPLTKGAFAIVDEEDFEWLNQWKWTFRPGPYAYRMVTIRGKQTPVHMHRLVNQTPDGLQTDHVNRNGLDNRRSNLRNATIVQNLQNQGLRRDSKTGVRGVSVLKTKTRDGYRLRFRPVIYINGKSKYLGVFKELSDAKTARELAEKRHFGEFASCP